MQLYSNNGKSSLASGITAVATSVTLATGEGTGFESPTGGDFELITVYDGASVAASTNVEIMKVTARSGDVLTVVRGQESTTPFAFSSAAGVEGNVTAGSLDSLREASAGPLKGVTETVHTASTVDIDPANGNMQIRTLLANETPTFSNVSAGQSVLIKFVPGAFTLTLTNVAKWTGAGAPSSIGAEHWIVVTNFDGTIVGTDVGAVA